jgi:single-strand DNA-binding protein
VIVFSKGLIDLTKSYIKKGDLIFVQGKMQTRKWQDSSGSDKYTTEIVLGNFDGKITMLGDGKSSDDLKSGDNSTKSLNDDLEDDIPF